jgi:signal transduction histidine kinase
VLLVAAQVPVIVDAASIERVIVNLLTNALKFSSPTSPVVVRVYGDGQRAIVAITDQGVGIDPEQLPYLFEKHYRARTVGSVEGTGLGLIWSRRILSGKTYIV